MNSDAKLIEASINAHNVVKNGTKQKILIFIYKPKIIITDFF